MLLLLLARPAPSLRQGWAYAEASRCDATAVLQSMATCADLMKDMVSACRLLT